MHTSIVWFRNDLRLKDNPALFNAIKKNNTIFLVYIEDTSEASRTKGSYQKKWLKQSLKALSDELHSLGHILHIYEGTPLKILKNIINKLSATSIFWNRCYEPKQIERDIVIKKTLKDEGINVETFSSYLLFEPWTVLNNQKEYFKVFTPFWKHCSKILSIEKPLSLPEFSSSKISIPELKISNLTETSSNEFFLQNYWDPGEKGAMKQLHKFLKIGLSQYAYGRDIPSLEATSKLSPYLHFGEISPKQIVFEVEKFVENNNSKELQFQKEKFFSELGWREFSYNLLYHFPNLQTEPFKPQYANFKWKKNTNHLKAWQDGLTGIPIIDAGMRELKTTGWMHNRIRMVVASFLVKNCMIHWHEGEKWFWDLLVDADLANNSASWQWVFGSGADAAPYFRVFNPILQSEKFDPEGIYIKKYVPELIDLEPKYLHDVSNAPKEILRSAGITLGVNYPYPIVDLNKTREEVLTAYKLIQKEK